MRFGICVFALTFLVPALAQAQEDTGNYAAGPLLQLESYSVGYAYEEFMIGARLGFGYRLSSGFKFGLDVGGGYVEADDTCNSAGSQDQIVQCYFFEDNTGMAGTLGPMVGFDYPFGDVVGLELTARGHYAWTSAISGWSASAGTGATFALAKNEKNEAIVLKVGLEAGLWDYQMNNADIFGFSFSPVVGLRAEHR